MADVKLHFSKESGKYKCNYCGHDLAATTSTTRLRGHLIGVANTGTKHCPNVPDDVRNSLSKKTATAYYVPPPLSNLPPPVEAEGMTTEATAMPVLPPNVSDQETVGFLAQNMPHLPLGAVMPPNETSSNPHQIDNYSILSFSPELNNDFGDQGWLLQTMASTLNPLLDNFPSFPQSHNNFSNHMDMQLGPQSAFQIPMRDEVMQDYGPVQNDYTNFEHGQSSGNIAVQDYAIDECMPLWLQDQTNEDIMVENESNLQHREIPRPMEETTLTNQTALSPTANVCADEGDQNMVQSCEGRVHVEVTSAEAWNVQRSNKRQRSTTDSLPIVPLTKRLVGEAFKINEEKIWSLLMDDQVLRIGIYGMGGVGKTTLMRHIQTRLKGQSSLQVFWITVSHDFSIRKLQNLIAKKIELSFNDNEDEVERAEKLTESLGSRGNYVLILDDLWNYFDVDEVGIPVMCKLVLTTRLLKICRQMGCSDENRIQMQALSEEEAWILFTRELGNYSPKVEKLAQAVCRECAGLPLGIKVMAKSMKGIWDDHTWRCTLEELKESRVCKGHEMQEQVFSVLKFSYLQLKDPALQECLSYCALFPEDYKIKRDDLIEYMIVEGIIDAKKSRRAEWDRGHTMLDALENACLLEGQTATRGDTRIVYMHDLIRDMVILELREGSKTLVEAGAQLTELPDDEKWTENLVRVSLIRNDIEVIPPGHTTRCPNLSTLLLCENQRLKMIADPFFEQFQSLKILDLSWCTAIEELPRSISDLVNLTGLSLRGFYRLIHVPSLAKLQKLKRLDLSFCRNVKQMPEGVEFLLNLKYLNTVRSGIEEIWSGVIPMLSRLQVLLLWEYGDGEFSIRGSEVRELRKLETLHCKFSDVGEFGEYMKFLKESEQLPTDCSTHWSDHSSHIRYSRKLGSRKTMVISGYNSIDLLALPREIEELYIYNCRSTLYRRLFSPSLLASLSNLQEIQVDSWYDIEIFATIEGENGEGRGFPFSNYSTHSLPNHSLLNLKIIVIKKCHNVKKLFPPSLLPNLHNLQEISVKNCCEMEEIFSTDQEEEENEQELLCDRPNLTALHLPKLSRFELRNLQKLRSIYKGAIICHSLHKIGLVECPELKRIPISLPQPSLQVIYIYPEEWWDSVQWGSADDKKHLNSLIVFDSDSGSDSDSDSYSDASP